MAYDPTVMTPNVASEPAMRSIKARHVQLGEEFVGQKLGGRYLLKSIVGAGGFGAVFEGEDTRIKKKVAVKLLFADMLRDHEAVIRFKLEAEAASQVGHANIIDITDFDFTEDGTAYMVMEFLQGEDLAHVIRKAEQPDLARVVRLCAQACRGLGAAHRKGIVHRDLKPGNIFVAQRDGAVEQVKVVDFGISRASELDDSEERLTKTGQILGTPYYMAPEQADGIREVDGRTDIYAMGIILYEGCTGDLPFKARTPIGLITKHASEVPRPPRALNPEISDLLQNTILKALEKDPEDRFADMVEMEQALLHCLALLDPTAAAVELAAFAPGSGAKERTLSEEALIALTTPASVLRKTQPGTLSTRPSPWKWIAMAGVVVAVAVGVILALQRQGSDPRRSSRAKRSLAIQTMEPEMRAAEPPRSRLPVVVMAQATEVTRPRPGSPTLPATVRITCQGVVPATAKIYDSDKKLLGSCAGGVTLPRGNRPIKVRLYHYGWVEKWLPVTPDRDRSIGPCKLRKIGKGGAGWRPPDAAMGW
jgi:serine/threonine-protein kinase